MTELAKERPLVFDTTLRDGAQMPGIRFSQEDRLAIAIELARVGVDILEAGFPSSSQQNFEAVRAIAETVEGPVICAFSGTGEDDIERAWEAVEPASHAAGARLNVCLPVSALHLDKRFGITMEQGLDRAVEAVKRARLLTDDVEYSAEDASRADPRFLRRVILAVAEAGASTIMIPDTVGKDLPDSYARLTGAARAQLDTHGFSNVRIAAHCHNDLGLAAANTWQALTIGGAEQMDVTAGGIGERAGNANLEQLVAIAREHPESGILTEIDTTLLTRLVRMVTSRGGVHLQPHLPVVGTNAFRHASGWHQHGMTKDRSTFEYLDAEAYGQKPGQFVISDQSGRAGVSRQLEDMGINIERDALATLLGNAENLIEDEAGRRLAHSDLEQLVAKFNEEELVDEITIDFEDLREETKHRVSTVTLTINGVEASASSGQGAVDAARLAINKATGLNGKLSGWDPDAPEVVELGSGSTVGAFVITELDGVAVEAYAVERSSDFASIAAYTKGLSMIRRIQRRAASLVDREEPS